MSAKKANPELWDKIKEEIKQKYPGIWSARKSQLLVNAYKRRGGKFIGPKPKKNNNLVKWTKEEWDYVDPKTKGRYLPKKVREKLTSTQKKETNVNKLNSGGLNHRTKWEDYVKVLSNRLGKN
jgi:hypothetical protein